MEVNATQVCEELMVAMIRIKTCLYELAETYNLRPQQFHILYTLDREGSLVMGQIAHALHCDPSNITGIVDRLVARKLISREECPTDRRAKALHLTEKGRAIIEDLRQKLPSRLGCTNLSTAQLYNLHEIADQLGH